MDGNIFYFGVFLIFFLVIKRERRRYKKIEDALKDSNQILLYKTFKLSLFNDSMRNLKNDLSQLIEKSNSIKPHNLFRLENSMEKLIQEKGIWQEYKLQFEKNYPDFSSILNKRNSDLSINDYKQATFVRLDMSTKEVASLTNVSPKAIENSKI